LEVGFLTGIAFARIVDDHNRTWGETKEPSGSLLSLAPAIGMLAAKRLEICAAAGAGESQAPQLDLPVIAK
jgi:hypothetical protein